jgi:hypothetical protein
LKLHKDGTVEGTPSEIAEYNKLQDKKEPFIVIPLESRFKQTMRMLEEQWDIAQKQAEASRQTERYVNGLMGAINSKRNLH